MLWAMLPEIKAMMMMMMMMKLCSKFERSPTIRGEIMAT